MRLQGELAAFAVALTVALVSAIPDYSGLYNQQHCRHIGCCTGREDKCASPILGKKILYIIQCTKHYLRFFSGTLCYCDNFCDRINSEDCCPDFWSHCRGISPPENITEPCKHNGKFVLPGHTVKENCNKW